MDVGHFIRTNLVNIILVLGLGGFIANRYGYFGWGSLPKITLQSSEANASEDPCKFKDRCVIAYMAPWCPSCQASAPFLNTLARKLNQSSKVGMKIILGMDDQSKLAGMAEKFSAPVFYDLEGDFASQVGIRSVPSVLVSDSGGKIIDKGLPGMISGLATQDENINYYIKNILEIGDVV